MQNISILILLAFFQSCSDKHQGSAEVFKEYDTSHILLLGEKRFSNEEEKLRYESITDVITDRKSFAWVNFNPKDSSSSLSLHFNLNMTDTIAMAYSSACWIMFPIKATSKKIIVFWDRIIDSKYDFDIVKIMNKIKVKPGEAFMELELLNDTTLIANYLIPGLVEKLNSASTERVLFPNKFTVCKTCF